METSSVTGSFYEKHRTDQLPWHQWSGPSSQERSKRRWIANNRREGKSMKSIGENLASVMDELVQQARHTAIEHDDRTLQEFAWKLKGLGDAENDDETMGLLRGVSVPEGFRHARYTIYEVIGSGPNGELLLGDPKPGGRLIDGRMGGLDLKRLVRTALVFTSDPDTTSMGPGRWLESFALPIRDPGTLELGLVVETSAFLRDWLVR